MLESELSYVRRCLALCGHAEWEKIAKAARVNFRTVKRIGYKEVRYPRSDSIGKLAMHFRTKEKRGTT